MSETGRRVALLARPGVACDRLREALAQAGAELVLEANPLDLEPSALEAAQAEVLMVALDAATEDALDRFDEALQDPAVEVIFEEADVVIRREGWEAARWVRHLSAKLHRHGDVLPPGAEPDGIEPEAPAWSVATAQAAAGAVAADEPREATGAATASQGHAFDPVAADSAGLALEAMETAGMPVERLQLEGRASAGMSPSDTIAFDAATPAIADDEAGAGSDAGVVPFDASGFDPVAFELATDASATTDSAGDITPFTFDHAGDLSLDDLRAAPRAATDDAGFDRVVDHAFADAFVPHADPDHATGMAGDRLADATAGAADAGSAATAGASARVLSLVDGATDDAAPAAAPAATAATTATDDRFKHDLAALELRIASLELVDDRPAKAASDGVVVILAGIGGPDAVRQLLGALPPEFARPVLVQQRLDGGRYDKLVAQMQRATSLPVKLAEAGTAPDAGAIYILSAQTGIAAAPGGLRFTDDAGDLLASVPPADSAVLMLSGSDSAQVDAVMNLSWAGALVGGQATEGCYDAEAPSALIARGGLSGTPVELARRLAQRWAS